MNGWSSVGTVGVKYGYSPSNAYFANGKDSRLVWISTTTRTLSDQLHNLPISPRIGGLASDGTDLYIRSDNALLDVVVN